MGMPENPPAFPNTGNATWGLAADEGMSLRDWFAGQAMKALLHGQKWRTSELANEAYRAADAMLAERSKS